MKTKRLISLILLSGLLFSCGSNGDTNNNVPGSNVPITPEEPSEEEPTGETEETVRVTDVTITNKTVNLTVDDTYLLQVVVSPENATNKSVKFFSSDDDIVTVETNGILTARKQGEAIINVKTVDGGYADTCLVKVKEKEIIDTTVHVDYVTLSEHEKTINEGESFVLNHTIYPENATNQNVSYSSSNEAIAKVNSSGEVKAIKEGNAIITVTTIDGAKVDYCNVIVKKVSQEEEEEEQLPAIDYVKISALKKDFSTIYAWTENNGKPTELIGSWPGKAMDSYDETWNTYDFIGYTSLYFIFSNNGNNQTGNLYVSHAGYYWYAAGKIYSSKPELDESGNPIVPEGDTPIGNYSIVKEAKTADDLPAVKNYNKGSVLYPYTGSRDDFRDESIYFMITTRFYDGDYSNNRRCWDGKNPGSDPEWRGDFKGLIEKMDYIKALGFTSIWITPVVKNASGYDYHGYHAINFKEVDPRYESQDVKFTDVIRIAHEKDMKIILDVVFNHTGNYGEENLFPMFKYNPMENATYSGLIRNTEYDLLPENYEYINQYDARINAMKGGSDVNNIYHHEKSMAYEQYIEQTGQMAGDCVDLNTENPTVANYLLEAYGEFIRMGVDAFRIDTMKHISRLTFNKYIWPGLYRIAEKCGNNHFYMFGEVCTRERGVWNHGIQCDSCPFYTWKESKEYTWGTRAVNEKSTLDNWNDNVTPDNAPTSNNVFLNGLNYHNPDYSRSSGVSTIDFPMHWNFQHANDAFNVAVGNDHYYNDASYNVTYVDSHDYGPDGAEKIRYNEGTDAWKENLDLLFTFRGVPCIYYGSEVEFQKGKTIDEGPNLILAESGRAYYGDYLSGSVTASDFGVYSATGTVSNTLNHTLSKHLQMLNKIRLKVPALRRGQYTTGNVSNSNMAFTRRYTVGSIDSLACVAISGGATFNNLPNGKYVDLVSGKTFNVSNGVLQVNQSGQGSIAIYVLENSSTGTLGKI